MAEFRHAIEIAAPIDVVFAHLVTPAGLTSWIGTAAIVDPRPGGDFALTIAGNAIRGHYLVVDSPHRVVISWGVEGNDALPPGASRVSFTLTPTATGTQVELVHSGLPAPLLAGHADGWFHFAARWVMAATGNQLDTDRWVPLPQRR